MLGFTDFPRVIQLTGYTCGSCSTYAITSFFGVDVSYRDVRRAVKTTKEGTEEGAIVRFLRSCRLRVAPRDRLTWAGLLEALTKNNVVLVGLDGDHYGVVHAYDPISDEILLADPSIRRQLRRRISASDFKRRWMCDGIIVRRRRRRARGFRGRRHRRRP